jgi:hypothetical protein
MNAAEITKTVSKLNNLIELAKTDSFYKTSLGFQRISVLPIRVRRNVNLACVLKGESNVNSMIEFLNTLTEQEFINWLKLA